MTLGPQEIVRSEMEGGLSGPANSLTDESIDCGCGSYRLPRLAKFATRRIFLALLCSIGLLQAGAQTYFHVTSSTIARKFGLGADLMEWIMRISDFAPAILGTVIAYWADRFHRASWLGALTLIQCASFFLLIVPQCVNDDSMPPENVTHASIYTGESSDLCMEMSSRLIAAEEPPYYSTLFILIIVQTIMGMANVAFYALGISYLDDNTKTVNASLYIGVVLATKFLGRVLGYMLGWGFLRIDADNFHPIESSYKNEIGAWWLGWPIHSILLAVPGALMSIFPRKLPSEMVEQAAATILDQSGTLRGSQRNELKKVGSTQYLPSLSRLLINKILVFNAFAVAFCVTALSNFTANENIFLESRFYAPRPTEILLGFGDPLVSRTIATIIKPILIGIAVIAAGLVIARIKPKTRTLVMYSFTVWLTSALIIFCLAFVNCNKAPIVGTHKGSLQLIQYCNKDCQCSRNADFRPICDSGESFIFYTPCHAGCSSVKYIDNRKIYTNCSCIENDAEAIDGPCGSSNCQTGWIIYEILTILIYTALASTVIGDVLITLRSVNTQDKALAIGYIMSLVGLFAYVIGKLSYDEFIKSTCYHWGHTDRQCHLHHPTSLGNYLCFATSGLIALGACLKIGVCFFSQDLDIYKFVTTETQQLTELKDMSKIQAEPLLQSQSSGYTADGTQNSQSTGKAVESADEPTVVLESTNKVNDRPTTDLSIKEGEPKSRLKYGPVGPGDRRVTKNQSNASISNIVTDDELDSSDSSQVPRKSSLSQVSYKPLEIDSDVESDLSGTAPRSRKCIPSAEFDESSKDLQENRLSPNKYQFLNPDNYEASIKSKNSRNPGAVEAAGKPTSASSLECIDKPTNDTLLSTSRGNFNEVGIPVMESYEATMKGSTNSLRSPTIVMSMYYLNKHPDNQLLGQTEFLRNSNKKNHNEETEENRSFRLEKLMQPIDYPGPSTRPPSRDRGSSGFGSLQDIGDKAKLQGDVSDSKDSLSSKSSTSGPPKKGSPLCTDL